MDQGVTIIDARPDWVTAFAHNGDRADSLEEQIMDYLENERASGDRVRVIGFEGFNGVATKHVFVGRRSDGVLIRAGGSTADDLLREISDRADHISRIDYCVTIATPDETYNPADELWRIGQGDDRDRPRLPSVTRTEKRWGGYTTYVGDRESAIVARVYNKTQESKGRYPPGSWRWEVELKRHASEQEHDHLRRNPKRAELATAIVERQFNRWHLVVPWRSDASVELWRSPPRERDLERTARWLHDQVGSSARRYVQSYGLAALHNILGLNDEESVTGA